MGIYQAPSKEQVRQYLKRRFGSTGPVPSPNEIRTALGWVPDTAPRGEAEQQEAGSTEREGSTA